MQFDQHQPFRFKHLITNSIVLRVLLLATLFLILPLILLSFYLYDQEVHFQKKENNWTFTLLTDRIEKSIEHLILMEGERLALFESLQQHVQDPNMMFTLIAHQGGVLLRLNPLITHEKGERYQCDQATNPLYIGQDFTPLAHFILKGNLLGHHQEQLLTDRLPFFLAQPSSFNDSIWIALLDANELLYRLGLDDHLPTHAAICLTSPLGEILCSTRPSFVGQTLTGDHRSQPDCLHRLYIAQQPFQGMVRDLPQTTLNLLAFSLVNFNPVNLTYFLMKVFSIMGIILLVGGGLTCFLTSRLAQPLNQLSSVMERVGEGDLDTLFKPHRFGFEINHLGRRFNEMLTSLKDHIQQAAQERSAKELFAHELSIGRQVQMNLLPHIPPDLPSLEIATHFQSAQEVGGDFYDFVIREWGGDPQMIVTIADTAGKGIGACLYSLIVKSMIKSFSSVCPDLSTTLIATNNLFCSETDLSGMFVTAWIGLIDPTHQNLYYSNCGHNPPLLRRQTGRIEQLSTTGIALGVVSIDKIEVKSTAFHHGDTLLLYTDGVVEAHNHEYENYGMQRLLQSFERNATKEPQPMVEAILDDLQAFVQTAEQHDDLTLIIIKKR